MSDFGADLRIAQKKAERRQKALEREQAESEHLYNNLFAENHFRREVTYGYGYPTTAKGENLVREASPWNKESWAKVRAVVIKRDGNRCVRCEARPGVKALTVHHIVPRSEGGDDRQANLVSLCAACHDWVECHEPRLRNRAEIIGAVDEEPGREFDLAAVREDIVFARARWPRRMPERVRTELVTRLSQLDLLPAAIADELGVSDAVVQKSLRIGALVP